MQSMWTLLFLAATVSSYMVDEGELTSSLEVIFPPAFRKPDGYKHQGARFGRPPYGGSIQANVYYIDSNLCDANIDYSRGGYPARDVDETGQMASWQPPFVLMMNRGECTFVEKVRNAQHAGASAAIIADTTCLCSAGDTCQSEDAMAQCESKQPTMADDGSGRDVTIPSYLMLKEDADPIKTSIKFNNTKVTMKMSWYLPRRNSRVEYSLWTTPMNAVSRRLLQNFGEVAKALDTHATFVPHMYIVDGYRVGCFEPDSYGNDDACSSLCTNKGRYCATAPDLDSGISGAQIVKESLRRFCIWEEYGKDGIGRPWWDYVNTLLAFCDDEEKFGDDVCVKEAMENAGVDYDRVEKCMTDSGGLGDNENIMLEKELRSRDDSGVVIVPSVFVNDALLTGALSKFEVFEAICAGFAEGTEPEICNACGGCPDVIECVDTGVCGVIPFNPSAEGSGSSPPGTVSTRTFTFWMFLVVCAFGVVGYWHYNKARDDMREQVRGMLAEYMPLEDQEVGNPMDLALFKGGTVPFLS